MKKTRMPQRLLSLVLVLMMLISVLPVSAMAAELTPSDPETGLTATDVTNELTDSDRLAIFEENMDSSKVSRSEIPADDEMVKVIVQLDADSLLDVRNRTNASMSMLDFQQTDAAKAQLKDIANLQLSVMNTMESKGIPSSFTFSYTSVVSGFAAQVPYGKIHDIKNIDGVEDVVLCQTYYTDSMGSATLGQALTAAEVAAYSNNTQYQGEGMLIGILDTGLDVNHEAFANAPAVQKLQKSSLSKLLYQISQGEDGKTNITAYSYAALWYAQKHSSSSLVLLTEDDLYKSGKVPFAFDYADADADVIPSADAVEKYGNDHGTHVAGITAGKTVDADGNVTKADGQALLDYVTGVLDSISNKDNADFDNDGNIDTYDAYLFFQQLNKSTVEIPANGSIHVEVNAKVLGLDKYDKASDNTGTYVEGYVYADEVASAEGVKGDSHSIPVLGYYGNWTDPSMFDIGSYLEYHEAKTESRVPYMYAYNKNATKYQALTVQYAGDSGMYYFGGNPYVDETYDPNRAAINPDTTVFARATFSLIRNAADSRATITGENGTVYYDKASGSPTAGAYYYSNGGSWRNAQGYIGINNAPTKAAEGEKITVKVTEAPEYYVTYDAEGNATTNWDALGDGASRTYTAFIDRTEPVLSNVYFKEDVETGTRSLVLTAQDNRYVAAAFLIDYDKMSILDRTAGSPEGAAEGAATDISLDLSKAEGVDHLLVQVADYADNTATYKINLNKEELSGLVSVTLDKQSIKMYKGGTAALNAEVSPFGVKPDGVTWKSSDETVATVNERGIITGVNKGTATITAASIKDPTATASCVVTVQTVDTTLVGALMDTNGDAQFYTWDMEHDTTWKKLVAFESLKTVSATTFDYRNGVVYVEDGENFDLHKLDLDTGKTLATYPGFEGEIPMWDMEYSMTYSTEAKPMLASVYYTYFMSPKPVDNLDLSAFDLGLYLWLFADASYFTAVTSLGANKIDTDDDGVKDTDTELFLALDDAGNIWTMNVYPTVDEKTGKDTWGASFGIIESNLANVGYAANPTDDGDLYDSLYATVEGQELVLYLANFTGDASHVYRILLNEDTGKWEAADIGNFGDGVWPATLVGTMYHANEDAAKADI